MIRSALANLALVIVSTLISVVVIDSVARAFYDRYVLVRPTPIFKNRWTTDERLARYDDNVSFSGNIIGDLAVMNRGKDGVERHVSFVTDDRGFRNSPEALKRRNNIILAGDSFGAGGSSSQEDMLCSLLSEDAEYSCYNISIGGFSPWQEFMTLKYEYDSNPKSNDATVVWLLFAGNDLDESYDADFKESPGGLLDRSRVRASIYFDRSPVVRAISNVMRDSSHDSNSDVVARDHAGKTVLFYKPYIARTSRTLSEVKSHRNYSKFESTLKEMISFVRGNKLTLAVVLVPAKEEVYKWLVDDEDAWSTHYRSSAVGEVIHRVMNEEDVCFLDLKPIFLEKSRELYEEQGKYLYWEDDTHWNNYGQAVAFEAVSRLLRTVRQGGLAERHSSPYH